MASEKHLRLLEGFLWLEPEGVEEDLSEEDGVASSSTSACEWDSPPPCAFVQCVCSRNFIKCFACVNFCLCESLCAYGSMHV